MPWQRVGFGKRVPSSGPEREAKAAFKSKKIRLKCCAVKQKATMSMQQFRRCNCTSHCEQVRPLSDRDQCYQKPVKGRSCCQHDEEVMIDWGRNPTADSLVASPKLACTSVTLSSPLTFESWHALQAKVYFSILMPLNSANYTT